MPYFLQYSTSFFDPPDPSIKTYMVTEAHYKDLVAIMAILNRLRRLQASDPPEASDIRVTVSEGKLKLEYFNGTSWVDYLSVGTLDVETLNVGTISVATLETGGAEFLTKGELIKWRCLFR